VREHRSADRIMLMASGDLPLEVRLARPDMVGIDRLVDAVAVNRLRAANRPAAIVDIGSAITVDLVSADGAFLGGAILPGIQMSARALHEFTDMLPLVAMSDLTAPPPALGTATEPAIEAGLFWGAIGAIRELIDQFHKAATSGRAEGATGGSSARAAGGTPHPASALADKPPVAPKTPLSGALRPQVFVTGGAGGAVAQLLDAAYVPNLTLAGIALTATCRVREAHR
jgi:pantothenate kinase type III